MRDRPETIEELINQCLDIDNRYWEAKAYKSNNNRSFSTSSGSSQQTSRTSTSNSNNRRPPPRPVVSAPRHLTSDYHLTRETREERMRSGKCLYCGQLGHTVAQCPKSKTSRNPNNRLGGSANAVEGLPERKN